MLCSRCGVDRPDSHFRFAAPGHYCKTCRSAYHKAYRAAHPESVARYQAERRKRRLASQEALITERGSKCEHCGEQYVPILLDWHHMENKSYKLATKLDRLPVSELRKETDKCLLLCCICHRLHHNGLITLTAKAPCQK